MQTGNDKVYLLMQPNRLLHRTPVLQLLKVSKQEGRVLMEELPIHTGIVNLHAKKLDPEARKILLRFSQAELEKERLAIELRFTKQYTEKDFDKYRDKQLARYYLQGMGQLKQYNQQLAWYHRLPQEQSNRVITAPCTYHSLSVQVEFIIDIDDDKPVITVLVLHGKQQTPLSAFNRHYFLLQKQHEYWHLTLKAYEALEWLEDHPFDPTLIDAHSYALQSGQYLKQEGHTVQLNKLDKTEELAVMPVPRVMLSELNNSFLMLTPQYVYDGHVLEGSYEKEQTIGTESGSLKVIRHEGSETALMQWLQGLHPNFSRQLNGYFYLSFAEAQKKGWFLKVYHQLLERNIELVGMDMLRHFKYSPHLASTQTEIQGNEGDFVILYMEVKFGKEKVPLGDLQKMLLNGQKAVLLKDGSLGVLGEAWLQQYAFVIKHSKVRQQQLLVPRWLAFADDNAGDEENSLALSRSIGPDWWKRWQQWQQNTGSIGIAMPSQLQVDSLRPYQQRGFEWMCLLAEAGGSACLADDMGLGKTLQTISFLLHRMELRNEARHLVVCPASLMYNWQQEWEKFAPAVKVHIYHGSQRQASVISNQEIQVIITSYGTARQDIALLAEELFDTIVVDESHYIKNPAAQITRAVSELRSLVRIALSGTPVMNGTNDLFAQFNFLLPGLLGNREFFRREYAYPIDQLRDEEKAQALQKLIAPFLLRRTKEQVAPDLPPKVESVIWCHMDTDQRMAYESIKEKVRSSVLLDIEQKGLDKGKMSILAGLTKLRQVCNSAELVKDEDVFAYDSVKTEMLIAELQQIIPAHKALVFSQFTSMLDLLGRDLQKVGIRFLRLDGSTAANERQSLVNAFQQDDADTHVFLISLKAGNTGLNLTAADYVFLFDPWWNVAVENQAIDRTHRIGQTSHVFAYRLICKNTVEEKIMVLKDRKRKISDELVSTDDGLMQSLTMEEVAFLFS
jgi:superfamily II DNA or RNA helicase